MKKLIPIFVFLAAFLLPSESHSACGLTLTASNIVINWDLNFSTQAIQFTLQKVNNPACDYWIGFTKGGGSSIANRTLNSGTRFLPYQLYKDNGYTKVLKDSTDIPISGTDDVLNGSFPAGTNITQTLLYFFSIPSNGSTTPTIAKDGVYTDIFTMNVYEGSDPTISSPVPVTSSNITISTTVPKMINMSLVSTGGSFNPASISKSIDFGSLAPGMASSFDLRVRSNAGYSVTFSSTNNGVLRPAGHTTGPGVPYLLYVNGSLLDMSNSSGVPVVGIAGTGQTSLEGLGYPIRIQIGNFSAALLVGGQQQDHVLVTATTTE